MVQVTVIKELIDSYSMKQVLDKANDILDEVNPEKEIAITEAMLRHDIDRETLPKNSTIRRVLLAMYFANKENKRLEDIDKEDVKSISGKDLYDLIVTEDLSKSLEQKFIAARIESKVFPQSFIFNLLKNFKYGKYTEDKYIETILVLMNLKFDDIKFQDSNWRHIAVKHISSLMTSEEFLDIKKQLQMSTPLTKVGETARVDCYKSIIAKLITLK